jgi:hypothetical protein
VEYGKWFDPVAVEHTTLYVKPLSWAEMSEILAMEPDAQRYRLVECSACDAEGHNVLEKGAAARLPAPLALRLFEAANRVNSLDHEAVEATEGN